jgi:hypothetical protein
MMLIEAEREFYDVWFNENCRQTAGYATLASRERGITYNHYARMYPFYYETWKTLGLDWSDGFPPLLKDPTPPCPWSSREAIETRLDELETGPFSHLSYQAMREYMRRRMESN